MDIEHVPACHIFREPAVLGGRVPEPYRTRTRGAEDGYYGRPAPCDPSADYLVGHAWGHAMRMRRIHVIADRPKVAEEKRRQSMLAGLKGAEMRRQQQRATASA